MKLKTYSHTYQEKNKRKHEFKMSGIRQLMLL